MTDQAQRHASELMQAAQLVLEQPGEAAALGVLLYDRWYAPATGATLDDLGPTEVAAHLRAADASSAQFEDGWTVVAPHEATERIGPATSPWQVPALRGGDARWIDPIDLVVPSGVGLRPSPGAQVVVCARRDSVSLLPNWWTTMSQAWWQASPPLLRLYWSVDPWHVFRVVERLTACLDPAKPYALKCPLDLDRCRRPDAVVLFLPAAGWPAMLDTLADAHREVAAWLRPRVPALTLQLAHGLALAEDPGHDSFGMHRCSILAQAWCTGERAGASDAATLRAIATSAFRTHGIPAATPWRSPGSTASYPWKAHDAGATTIAASQVAESHR